MIKFDRHVRKSFFSNITHIIKFSRDAKYKCFFCKIDFPCEGSLSVHLTTLRHVGLPNAQFIENPEFLCMICGSDIPIANVTKHQCLDKALKNYYELVQFIDEFGSPNMCLLCRGMLFPTPAHLNIHIILSHILKQPDSAQKNSQSSKSENPKSLVDNRCPICLSKFLTNDMIVLHRHAYADHTPEMGITMLNNLSGFSRAKYGSPNDLKQWVASRIYSCNFPNFRIKRHPTHMAEHINRLVPEYTASTCKETFPSLFNLSAHLCTYHFVEDFSVRNTRDSMAASSQLRAEQDRRFFLMRQEIDLRRKNLISKGIILESILASKYCLECFRIYDTNLELQVHYMVFHLNMTWNICGICAYDCKVAIGLVNSRQDDKEAERSHVLLWNALWNHERSHIEYFKQLVENPSMPLTEKCMYDVSSDLSSTLKPVDTILSPEPVEKPKQRISAHLFTPFQITTFLDIGVKNVKMQTEYIINEELEEKGITYSTYMEIEEKSDTTCQKSETSKSNSFVFSPSIKVVTPTTTTSTNSIYSAKLERTRNWVLNSKPSLLQSLLKNNNKSSNQTYMSSPIYPSQLTWPVDPQTNDNNIHVEPLEDLEGSSILSEFESYYTAKSELSIYNNPINIPESSDDDSSRTSILDLDNVEEITNVEERLMQEN